MKNVAVNHIYFYTKNNTFLAAKCCNSLDNNCN